MATIQELYDQAMLVFSREDYDGAIVALQILLEEEPDYFDARLALGMAYCRKGDHATAILEGHKAERLRPDEQLVHTNLSVFYVKAGNIAAAERHAMRAKVAAWKGNMAAPTSATEPTPELGLAAPRPKPIKVAGRLPDMPWRKKSPSA
jgi:Flp pilus assembly protein TadD